MIGIPATFNAMWRPVEALEMLTRAALAEDTESVGTKPADAANAQMVVKADVFDVMIRPHLVRLRGLHHKLPYARTMTRQPQNCNLTVVLRVPADSRRSRIHKGPKFHLTAAASGPQ